MLAAAMTTVTHGICDKLEMEWSHCDSIDDKLNAYFEIAIISTYELLKERPDARDILLGVGEVSNNVAIKADQRKIGMLTKELQAYQDKLEKSNTDAKSVAQFIVSTTGNLKYTATSKRQLKSLLETLKLSVIALTQGH